MGAGEQRDGRRVPTAGVRIEEGEVGHGGVGEQTAVHDDHVVGPTAASETGVERRTVGAGFWRERGVRKIKHRARVAEAWPFLSLCAFVGKISC